MEAVLDHFRLKGLHEEVWSWPYLLTQALAVFTRNQIQSLLSLTPTGGRPLE
jgi:hypothetical protein